jgi:PPIC-type PPIASE domain
MLFRTLRQFSVLFLAPAFLVAVVHAQTSAGSSATPDAERATSTSPDQRVVLRVGGVAVTEAEFETNIKEFEGQGEEGEGDAGEKGPEKSRRDMGNDYASVLMLSQQAVSSHLDQTPKVHHDLEVARLQVLSDAEFASLMEQAKPSAEEMQTYYDAHKGEYDIVYVRRLFIWKKGPGSNNSQGLTPQDAKAKVAQILATYKAGGDPSKIADEFNNSPNGLLDATPSMFTRKELPPAQEAIAFDMKPGEWRVADDKPDAFIIYQLTEHRSRKLDEVRVFVEKEVQAEKMQAKLAELRKNAGIWMDKDYFGNGTAPADTDKMPMTSGRQKQQATQTHQENNNAN